MVFIECVSCVQKSILIRSTYFALIRFWDWFWAMATSAWPMCAPTATAKIHWRHWQSEQTFELQFSGGEGTGVWLRVFSIVNMDVEFSPQTLFRYWRDWSKLCMMVPIDFVLPTCLFGYSQVIVLQVHIIAFTCSGPGLGGWLLHPQFLLD